MKKIASALLCVSVLVTAGCTAEAKDKKSSVVKTMTDQELEDLCGGPENDGDLRVKDQFTDTGCYSA